MPSAHHAGSNAGVVAAGPSSGRDRPAGGLVETHISWVLLTERLAYKLKKPVACGFVDFARSRRAGISARKRCVSTGGWRRRCTSAWCPCAARRRRRASRRGEPIDFVVCMRRFPDGACCANCCAAGGCWRRARGFAAPGGVSREARSRRLSAFGDAGAVSREPSSTRWRAARRVDGMHRSSLQSWLGSRPRALRDGMVARQRDGRVRECHGDLHLANVVLLEGRADAPSTASSSTRRCAGST